MSNQDDNNNNDYALARELGDRAGKIIALLAEDVQHELEDTYYYQNRDNAEAINRSYVLLVNELEKIYARNKSLADLNDEPRTRASWSLFNTIESNETAILDYGNEHRKYEEHLAHRAQVNRLATLAGKETPDFTPELKKIIGEADKVIKALSDHIHELIGSRPTKYRMEWYIPGYKLVYKDDGNIVINGVLKLKKTQNGSAPRKLMEQAVKHPNELFKPELGQITRNLTSILSDMGIAGTLKELFFPIADKDGVKFRPMVRYDTAYEERIDTAELDKQLKKLGAKTQHVLDQIFDDEWFDEETKAILAQHQAENFFQDGTERKNP